MAKITLVSEEMPLLLPMMHRSPGIHVSEIISNLCVRLGHYAPSEEFNQAQLEVGNAFERAHIARLQEDDPERYVYAGELTVDGIHGTPDLLDVIDEAVNEFKCTWMSTKHTPGSEKFWKYEQQVKSYSYMMGWQRALLRILHVNGDYMYGRGDDGLVGPSRYRAYLYEFTQGELNQHWRVMLSHAEAMRRERSLTDNR